MFSCGLEPAGGPGLVFKVLPMVFNSMNPVTGFPTGTVFAVIFFVLLVTAALTSAISLFEAITAWATESLHIRRTPATLVIALCVIAIAAFCSLSLGPLNHIHIAGMPLFDLVDRLTAAYLPPICALLTVLFFGWVMPGADIHDELSNHGTLKTGYYPVLRFLTRYIAPIALLLVLITGIFGN